MIWNRDLLVIFKHFLTFFALYRRNLKRLGLWSDSKISSFWELLAQTPTTTRTIILCFTRPENTYWDRAREQRRNSFIFSHNSNGSNTWISCEQLWNLFSRFGMRHESRLHFIFMLLLRWESVHIVILGDRLWLEHRLRRGRVWVGICRSAKKTTTDEQWLNLEITE